MLVKFKFYILSEGAYRHYDVIYMMKIGYVKNNNLFKLVVSFVIIIEFFSSCKSGQETPVDTKYLKEFHLENFEPQEKYLQEGNLNLYVDYSTCNQLGQNSPFFQDVAASLVNKTTSFYSIKGKEIRKEEGDVYTLLRNIQEINYAELAKASQMMAEGECESVMITDGEYYTPSMAKGHDNDPYFANAFKTWILRGYDIHIISEPYIESYKSHNYNKKRFYIIFTDDRMQNNIYKRICRTVDFSQYPEVDEFHMSVSHPLLKGNGNNSSIQNQYLMSKSKGYGTFEIQDWEGCDWNTIEENLINAYDEETGLSLDKGATIIEMGLDKTSFGCYQIQLLSLKEYDINQEYFAYYEAKNNGEQSPKIDYELPSLDNFMEIDKKEFIEHGKINIAFNKWFNPSDLSGKPYNYFKVDIMIDKVQSVFDQHEEKFIFESIAHQGAKNVSVASSIKQCLADDEVLEKMRGQIIYSIYIKSERFN